MIYEIEIKNGKVEKFSKETIEWDNGGLRLINYCLEDGRSGFISHDYLDVIQDYYNKDNDCCCWNFSEEDFVEEDNVNYAKITIDGITRYYEEW